eukprot:120553-Pyramimonas_sp.AAC.1
MVATPIEKRLGQFEPTWLQFRWWPGVTEQYQRVDPEQKNVARSADELDERVTRTQFGECDFACELPRGPVNS